MRPLVEQVILLTGATDGLGKAVDTELARSGATLLLHGRDETRGQHALEEIRAQTGNTRLHWYRADFSSLAQVRAMAERMAHEQERLDVLLNNVGIGSKLPGSGRRQESEDGYELALVMFTFDLAEELAGSDVTVNCLHPATYMPTKIVLAARGRSFSTIEEGVQASLRLITAAELDQSSGRYFNGLREARAESQAYDRQARHQLRQLSERLAGLTGP